MVIECSFPAVELAVADQLCADLHESLTRDIADTAITRVRTDSSTQDFGATLVIVLASPTAVVLGRELGKWLARRHDAHLRLRRTGGDGVEREVDLTGPITARAERLIRGFLDDRHP